MPIVESFNARFREYCLNALADARSIIEDWRTHFNRVRPHRSLGKKPADCLPVKLPDMLNLLRQGSVQGLRSIVIAIHSGARSPLMSVRISLAV